jgi:DNA primase
LFHKGKNLYALHHALPPARSGEPFIVVEGYMDVIALHQSGIKAAVAPLGTALTGEQIQLLWKTHEMPILWFDGDEAGQRAAERAALKCLEVLKPGYSLQFAFLPQGDDPDTLIRRQGVLAARQCLAKTMPLIDVLWRIFLHQRSLEAPEQKAKARKDLIELTQSIQDPDTRHFYRQELNQRLQLMLTRPYRSEKGGVQSQK